MAAGEKAGVEPGQEETVEAGERAGVEPGQEETVEAGKKAEIAIRADGNADIGVGHLMRCLTIAGQTGERAHVVFWCADEASVALVRERGYEALALGTDYRDMDSELPRLEALVHKGQKPGMILVDSYFVTEDYLRALGAYGSVYLLEDMPGHIWPVDGVINYNAFARRSRYEAAYGQSGENSPGTRLCIGASYAPLRPQFTGCDYQVNPQVREVLITTGGGDGENIAGRILERLEDREFQIHVVSGPCNPHGAWLADYAQAHPRVTVHQRVEDMAGLMLGCDLAVTAGGTTIYELCALGVPFVCFSYAENQEALTEYAGEQGIGLCAGKYHQDGAGTLERIGHLVRLAAADAKLRREMSRKAKTLVDGQGASRLADALVEACHENTLTRV